MTPTAEAELAKHRTRKAIVDKINTLSSTEHAEIYKLIKNNKNTPEGLHFTHNSNGAFVNFSNLPDDVVEDVSKFTDFVFNNKVELDDYDRRINECKMKNDCKPLGMSQTASELDQDDVQTEPSSTLSSDPTDWQRVINNSVKTERDKQELSRFMEAVLKSQQTADAKVGAAGKTNAKNKFLVARKKYSKKHNRTTDADLPDHLVPDDDTQF